MLFKRLASHQYWPGAIATLFAALVAVDASAAVSTITNVTLYPAGATVERQVRLRAGSTRVEVNCLPASFDPQSLRLVVPPGVQPGDFRIEDAASGGEQFGSRCETTSRDKRIEALQASPATLNARAQAIELSTGYFKNM